MSARWAAALRALVRPGSAPLWVALGLGVAAVLNLLEFRGIDAAARHNYQALHRYDHGDLFDIAIARDNSARQRVAPFVYFGRLFPDATVVIPRTGVATWFDFVPSMTAFGRVRAIEVGEYDPVDAIDLAAIAAYRVTAASFAPRMGSTQRVVDARVAYYAAPEPSGVFVVVTPDGVPDREGLLAFVDAALVDGAVLETWGVR